jgi:biopolymer transport protein ExbB/TolQ
MSLLLAFNLVFSVILILWSIYVTIRLLKDSRRGSKRRSEKARSDLLEQEREAFLQRCLEEQRHIAEKAEVLKEQKKDTHHKVVRLEARNSRIQRQNRYTGGRPYNWG